MTMFMMTMFMMIVYIIGATSPAALRSQKDLKQQKQLHIPNSLLVICDKRENTECFSFSHGFDTIIPTAKLGGD